MPPKGQPMNPFSTAAGGVTRQFGAAGWYESDLDALKRERSNAEDAGNSDRASKLNDAIAELESADPEEF